MSTSAFTLTGLIAAPFTPFRPDGSLNREQVPSLCESLVENGVSGAFIGGTTGEGLSLTVEERVQLTEAWVRSAKGRISIIVHVSHLAVPTAQELAEHAARAGADAIASTALVFLPQDLEQTAATAAAIAAAAPTLPYYYYHIPACSRTSISSIALLESAATLIPNLRGVKFTHDDFEEFLRLLQCQDGRYDILSGREQMLLSALALGTRGSIGSTFSFAAPLFHRLRAAYLGGDLETARSIQGEAIRLILVLRKLGGLRAMKAVMAFIGLDCGQPRLPVLPLSSHESAELARALQPFANSLSGPLQAHDGLVKVNV